MGLPEDRVIRILAFFVVFFACIVLGLAWLRPDDGQTFSVFTAQLAGFAGALLLRFSPDKTFAPPTITSIPTVSKPIVVE